MKRSDNYFASRARCRRSRIKPSNLVCEQLETRAMLAVLGDAGNLEEFLSAEASCPVAECTPLLTDEASIASCWIFLPPPDWAICPIFIDDVTDDVTDDLIDPTTGTNSLTGDAADGSADGNAAATTDSGNRLTTDPTVDPTQGTDTPLSDPSSSDGTQTGVIDTGSGEGLVFDHVIAVDPPVWVMRHWGSVPMVEDIIFVCSSVAQPPLESPAVGFSESPVVAFAGSDQPVAVVLPESRAAAFATLPDNAQANSTSLYAAFAAGFIQSSGDGQGSGAFAGTKRSARH